MNGGVMSFTVVNATMRELLSRLLKSVTGAPAVFEAKSTDDPSENPALRRFEVQVQALLLDTKPFVADVIDQDNNWFRITLDEDLGPIEFQIDTTPH